MRIQSNAVAHLAVDTRVTLKQEGATLQILHEGKLLDQLNLAPYASLFERRSSFEALIKPDGIMPIRYAGLHQHSWYSLLDGLISPPKMAEVAEYASAITDHGNMHGYFTFYQAMKKNGKKPIVGVEVYTESLDGRMDANHLLLLAETNEGLQNLIKLNSLAWENMYRRPQVKWEWLREYSKGVICLTACLGGEIPRAFTGTKERYNQPARPANPEQAKVVLAQLLDIFGQHNVFLEIQRHGDEAEAIVNPGIEWLSAQTGVPIVATTDSHYGYKADMSTHEIQLCMQTGAKLSDEKRFKFKGTGFHMLTSDEMVALFGDHPEWLDNTLAIAERCHVEIETGNYKLPVFEIPPVFADQDSYLEHLCWQGFETRFTGTAHYHDPAYHERLKFELGVIKGMGFPGYFLIVADFIGWAKSQDILVGPGRGSACGSMVAFVTGITDADPIEYHLLFERFLNPDRVSMPDIDIDFQDDRREEVINYVKDKYGIEAVSRIVTFGTLAAKAAVKDVARVLIDDDPESKVSLAATIGNKITKTIPSKPGTTLKKAMEESVEFKNLYDTDAQCREIIDIAFQVEGLPRQTGSHACGIIISDRTISDYVPTFQTKNSKTGLRETTCQVTMGEAEELGMLKVDFLGLRTLGVMSEAIELINRREDVVEKIDFNTIPLEDVPTYDFLSKGQTAGVFQLESAGMTALMRDLYQDASTRGADYGREMFERLVAGLSLYRPGPMDEIPNYLKYMMNPESITYPVPELREFLDSTYSVITYQEQVSVTRFAETC